MPTVQPNNPSPPIPAHHAVQDLPRLPLPPPPDRKSYLVLRSNLSEACTAALHHSRAPATTIILPRTAFIVTTALCLALTLGSMLALAWLLYQHQTRRRQSRAARAWGRQSRYRGRRASLVAREIEREYERFYGRGVVEAVVENPEMPRWSWVELGGKRSPREIMGVDDDDEKRELVRAGTGDWQVRVPERVGRKSLFWFEGEEGGGVWMPKR